MAIGTYIIIVNGHWSELITNNFENIIDTDKKKSLWMVLVKHTTERRQKDRQLAFSFWAKQKKEKQKWDWEQTGNFQNLLYMTAVSTK